MRPPRRLVGVALALTLGSTAIAACSPAADEGHPTGTTPVTTARPPTSPPGTPAARGKPGVKLSFEDAPYPPATSLQSVRNRRGPKAPAKVLTVEGGKVMSAAGHTRTDKNQSVAARFPAFDPSATAPRAGLAMTDKDGDDDLAPGRRTFTFGADFRLDPAPTSSREEGSRDDGDNLMQRGLANDPVQYKLQLDDRTPSCRMHTAVEDGVAVGEQVVTITDPAFVPLDESWHRLRCTRTKSALRLKLIRLGADGRPEAVTTARTDLDTVLDLTWNDRAVPFTVGAKIFSDGSGVMPGADQFNGIIDNVILTIRR